MTDETYTLTQTNKERGAMRSGARHKVNGSKSKRCTLPSDHLTPAQKRKLNGPTEAISLKQPLTYDQLLQVSPSLQHLYLTHLVEDLGARRVDLVEMLGCCQNSFAKLVKSLPEPLIFHGKPKTQDPRWIEFISGDDDPDVLPATPDPEPDPDPEPTPDPEPDSEPTPDPDPRPKKVDLTPPTPFEILSGSFTVHCNLVDLIKTLAPLIDGDQSYTFTLSFTK